MSFAIDRYTITGGAWAPGTDFSPSGAYAYIEPYSDLPGNGVPVRYIHFLVGGSLADGNRLYLQYSLFEPTAAQLGQSQTWFAQNDAVSLLNALVPAYMTNQLATTVSWPGLFTNWTPWGETTWICGGTVGGAAVACPGNVCPGDGAGPGSSATVLAEPAARIGITGSWTYDPGAQRWSATPATAANYGTGELYVDWLPAGEVQAEATVTIPDYAPRDRLIGLSGSLAGVGQLIVTLQGDGAVRVERIEQNPSNPFDSAYQVGSVSAPASNDTPVFLALQASIATGSITVTVGSTTSSFAFPPGWAGSGAFSSARITLPWRAWAGGANGTITAPRVLSY
jgi:hypothetical protein